MVVKEEGVIFFWAMHVRDNIILTCYSISLTKFIWMYIEDFSKMFCLPLPLFAFQQHRVKTNHFILHRLLYLSPQESYFSVLVFYLGRKGKFLRESSKEYYSLPEQDSKGLLNHCSNIRNCENPTGHLKVLKG